MSDLENPIDTARADGRTTLTEAEAKTLLADVGITTTEFTVAGDPTAAANAAAEIGFPVVLKVSSPSITHKSEWANGGGVVLGLEDQKSVETAAERVFATAEREGMDNNDVEVLVEEARDVDRGTEVIVGGLRDSSFGPIVLTGLGGVFTEVYEDTSHRLAPLDHGEARRAIEELAAAKLLMGYRGSSAADVDALADVVCAVGDLLTDYEEIIEVDVNPVLAVADGAVALDALVLLEED